MLTLARPDVMSSKFESLKEELAKLVWQIDLLYYAMIDSVGKLPEALKKKFEKHSIKLPNVTT